MANPADARKVTTVVEAGKITRTTSVAGQQVAKREFTNSTNAQGETLTVTKNWDGAAWHTSTTCRYPQGVGALTAGRLKWQEHADGTATTYSYVSSSGDTVVTIRRGAGSGSGVTAGTQTVRTLNESYETMIETVTDIASGITLSTWTGSNPDNMDRPTVITYDDGTTATIIYSCCGYRKHHQPHRSHCRILS